MSFRERLTFGSISLVRFIIFKWTSSSGHYKFWIWMVTLNWSLLNLHSLQIKIPYSLTYKLCIFSPWHMTSLEQQKDKLLSTQKETGYPLWSQAAWQWQDGALKPESTCELADSSRKNCVTANTTLKKVIQPDEKWDKYRD